MFVTASWSKCNIEKSRPVSLTESDLFNPIDWSREVISKADSFLESRSLCGSGHFLQIEASVGNGKYSQKDEKVAIQISPFHSRVKVINSICIRYA